MVLDEEEEIVNSVVNIELNLDMKDGKMSMECVLIVYWDDFVFCIEQEYVLFFGGLFELNQLFLFWQ